MQKLIGYQQISCEQHFQQLPNVRQKAKEAAVKVEAGEKYVLKSKPKHIEFGDDDCGEDLSS
eukprot:12892798-Prorocentrum_lima.AAC.1